MMSISTMIRHQYRERLCLTRAGVPFFVFVAFTLALMLLISQYSAFNGLPLSIQEAKAIKHKDSPPPSQGLASNEGNAIASSSSSQDDTASSGVCINYNP